MPMGLNKCLRCLKSTGVWLISRDLEVWSARRRLTPNLQRGGIIRIAQRVRDQRLRLRVTLILGGLVSGNQGHARQAVCR